MAIIWNSYYSQENPIHTILFFLKTVVLNFEATHTLKAVNLRHPQKNSPNTFLENQQKIK